MAMKFFLTLFKRAFDYMPDILDKYSEKGAQYVTLIERIINCVRKQGKPKKEYKIYKDSEKEDLNFLNKKRY